MPVDSIARTSTPQSFSANEGQIHKPPKSEFHGFMRLSDAFLGQTPISYSRGAMQGEGVYAAYDPAKSENYLYSLNAQTSVIASLYNPINKTGAMIHIDHNDSASIDDVLSQASQLLDPTGDHKEAVIATLTGGVWLLGGGITAAVEASIKKVGIEHSWEQWAMSSCIHHTYGSKLDLETGKIDVFEHAQHDTESFYAPLLREALKHDLGDSTEQRRAAAFMARVRAPAIAETNDGYAFVSGDDRRVTWEDYSAVCPLQLHKVD